MIGVICPLVLISKSCVVPKEIPSGSVMTGPSRLGSAGPLESGHAYEHLAGSVLIERSTCATSMTRYWPAAGHPKRTRIVRLPVTAAIRAVRICPAISRCAANCDDLNLDPLMSGIAAAETMVMIATTISSSTSENPLISRIPTLRIEATAVPPQEGHFLEKMPG